MLKQAKKREAIEGKGKKYDSGMSKKEKVYECNIECRMCGLGCLFDVLYNGE